jgi:hypothetical protein
MKYFVIPWNAGRTKESAAAIKIAGKIRGRKQ